jgi:hypothetical protein
MSQLIETLKKIEAILRLKNFPILNKLNEGKSIEKLSSHIETLIVPAELLPVYAWHDGTNITGDNYLGELYFFSELILLSLTDGLAVMAAHMADNSINWTACQFPLFMDGAGDVFYLDKQPDSENFNKIVRNSPSFADYNQNLSYYDSLELAFTTILKCYEQNLITFSDKNIIESDFKRIREISQELNPNSKYWQVYELLL